MRAIRWVASRVPRLAHRASAAWHRVRRRYWLLDHLVRAALRYREADGRRLAAAVTYYAFFAAFALAMLGFATLGFVLEGPAVESYVAENLPQLDTGALRRARGTVGVIAFVSLPVIALLWVDALRSSIRAIWRRDEYPGRMVRRILIEILVLIGLGVLLGASLAIALGTNALMDRLVLDVLGADVPPARWLLAGLSFGLGLGVNTLLAIAVLTGLPRLRVPLRLVIGPALLIAVGLELLKTVGRLLVARIDTNPAFQVAAGTAGLLVFLFVLNQLILFAAALTATAPRPRTGTTLPGGSRGRWGGLPGRSPAARQVRAEGVRQRGWQRARRAAPVPQHQRDSPGEQQAADVEEQLAARPGQLPRVPGRDRHPDVRGGRDRRDRHENPDQATRSGQGDGERAREPGDQGHHR